MVEVVNSKEENSEDFCPTYVQEFSLSYFTSPFEIAKRLERRLSVSPATPFSDASLPNNTKMFELEHIVSSMDDFARLLDVEGVDVQSAMITTLSVS